MTVECIEVPADIYHDFLEAHLLLSAVRHLHVLCFGELPPRQLGMLARNDVLQWACTALREPWRRELVAYAGELSSTFSVQMHATLPVPHWQDPGSIGAAERLAMHMLEAGSAPIWSAARQLAILLDHEQPRHSMALRNGETSSVSFGAYAKGPFHGLCRKTLTHPNVAMILNCLIMRVCPRHTWTTLALHFNYGTPPHRDKQNSHHNLVLALSLHDDGELWIETPEGDEAILFQGMEVWGIRYALQLHAVRFQAHQLLHYTCAWDTFDRVTLVAYTVQRWESLGDKVHTQLSELGFHLPERTVRITRDLHLDCLPCVLRD
ncbi:pola1 [Symbiodinium sp. CCMP2592]|nr:pola1 [Symbiodinium sp. CCMP2592]